jgi:hypothetical protein
MKPPVRLDPPMSEAELKKLVLKCAYEHGWAVYHVTHSPVRGSQGIGYPDLTLARDGEVLWLELKREGGSLTLQQAAWIAILPAAHVIRPEHWRNGRVGELLA